MKTRLYAVTTALAVLFLGIIMFGKKDVDAYQPIQFFNKNGMLNISPKIWMDTILITSATQTIDCSSANFTKVVTAQVQPALNTSSASSVPLSSIKSFTNTSVTINTVQSNTTTVGVLGVNVVGLTFPSSFSNMYALVIVCGY